MNIRFRETFDAQIQTALRCIHIDVQKTVLYNDDDGGDYMLATNYTNLRDNMKEYFDQAADSFEPLVVTRKGENMVIMSQTLYDSLMETVYLMSSEKNHQHLARSIEQYKNGKTVERKLSDDKMD